MKERWTAPSQWGQQRRPPHPLGLSHLTVIRKPLSVLSSTYEHTNKNASTTNNTKKLVLIRNQHLINIKPLTSMLKRIKIIRHRNFIKRGRSKIYKKNVPPMKQSLLTFEHIPFYIRKNIGEQTIRHLSLIENKLSRTGKMSGKGTLRLSLKTWVPSLELTRWKGRARSCKLSFDFCIWAMAHTCAHTHNKYIQLNKLSLHHRSFLRPSL